MGFLDFAPETLFRNGPGIILPDRAISGKPFRAEKSEKIQN